MSKNTSELFKKAILVALGATAVTAEKINGLIDELVEKGEMNEQQAKSFKEEIKQKAMTEKATFENKIQDVIQKTISKIVKDMGLVTVKDLEELEKRLTSKISGAPQHEHGCQCDECTS